MILLLGCSCSFGQQNNLNKTKAKDRNLGKHVATSEYMADGYVVYRTDTMYGLLMLGRTFATIEQPVDSVYSHFHTYKLKDTGLKTIMMYNYDKKPMCLTRVRETDRHMMRLLHEGKLNVYDDRADYIYSPQDIDKFLIVVACDGEVDKLGAFLSANTKRDLIGYINDIYGMKIDPTKITWPQLLKKMDQLD